jgi:hypothetical protein
VRLDFLPSNMTADRNAAGEPADHPRPEFHTASLLQASASRNIVTLATIDELIESIVLLAGTCPSPTEHDSLLERAVMSLERSIQELECTNDHLAQIRNEESLHVGRIRRDPRALLCGWRGRADMCIGT